MIKKYFSDKILRKKIIIWSLGVIAGLIGGYVYYIRIGCNSGGCPITSNPYMTMLYGGLMGYFVSDFFVPKKTQTPEESQD